MMCFDAKCGQLFKHCNLFFVDSLVGPHKIYSLKYRMDCLKVIESHMFVMSFPESHMLLIHQCFKSN